jgi:hypothetical protein
MRSPDAKAAGHDALRDDFPVEMSDHAFFD